MVQSEGDSQSSDPDKVRRMVERKDEVVESLTADGGDEAKPTAAPQPAEAPPAPSTDSPAKPPAEKTEAVESAPLTPRDAQTKEMLQALKAAGPAVELSHGKSRAEERKRKKEAAHRKKREERLQRSLAKHSAYASRVVEQLGLDPNRPITEIPPLPSPEHTQVEFTTVEQDRSYIRVGFDKQTNRYLYEVIEPKLSPVETEVLTLVRDTLVRTMEARPLGDEDAEHLLLRAIDEAIVDYSIVVDEVSKSRIQYYIIRDFVGFGPIDVLMKDPMIEDISCDGPHVPIFLFHRQYEAIETNILFAEESRLDSFVIRLAQRCGKQISIAEPLLDATLPDKSRLQAALSREVTTGGSTFTIRKFRSDPLTPSDLVRLGTMSPEMAAYFWIIMENGMSLIYAGGTASGKTSSLNAIATFIPAQKKIVSIEDTREINLKHKNWIAGLTRTGFGGEVVGGKVAGTIDMYKLLEAALRQRPEYLLVGEVRGPEALTLFQAMATGHATYSTMHADSVPSAVYRLENPPINVPRIMLQSLSCVAIQLLARVKDRMVRRVREVVEMVGIDPDTKDLMTNTVLQWDPGADVFRVVGKSKLFAQIMERKSLTDAQMRAEWQNRAEVVRWMVEKGIRRIDDVSNIIAAYYSRPQALMDLVHGKASPVEVKMKELVQVVKSGT